MNRSFNRASLGITFPTAPGQPPPPALVGPFDNVDGRLRATQTLFDWAAVSRLRAARAQTAGVSADEEVVAEAAAHGAALAWLRAARARALVTARLADSVLAADLARLADAQAAAGIAPAIDATRARTQLVAARGAVIVAEAERARSAVELSRALGMEADASLVTADSLGPGVARTEVPGTPDSAAAYALAHRPDVKAEVARRSAMDRAAAAIAAERLPRLELALDYGVNGPAVHDVIGTGQVAVQVSLPLFDGWRREGRVAEQRALARESAVRLRDLERQVRADVTAALLDVTSADAQVAIAGERLRLADAELAQARERFAAGVTGNIELITAQLALLDARDAAINARYMAAAARVALARAGGAARRLDS
jgi:outer membrane protein TolC